MTYRILADGFKNQLQTQAKGWRDVSWFVGTYNELMNLSQSYYDSINYSDISNTQQTYWDFFEDSNGWKSSTQQDIDKMFWHWF
jgi:hypothetical protein